MCEEIKDSEKKKLHIRTIRTHRRVVMKWCFKMGIGWLGLVHDLSKYSRTELSIYKYYTGKYSPHDEARKVLGYSPSWYHHKTRNKHHWEYWVDSLEIKNAVRMPFKYVIEMFCDFIGAGQAYNKGSWTQDMPLQYHLKTVNNRIYNPDTLYLFELLCCNLRDMGVDRFLKWYKSNKYNLKSAYNLSVIKERFRYEICRE